MGVKRTQIVELRKSLLPYKSKIICFDEIMIRSEDEFIQNIGNYMISKSDFALYVFT